LLNSSDQSSPNLPSNSGEILTMVYGLKRRIRNLEWFLKLAFELNRTLDRSETITLILNFFKNNLHVDGFSFWLVSGSTKKLEMVTFFGTPAEVYLSYLLSPLRQPPFKLGHDPDRYHYFDELPTTGKTEPGSLLILPLAPEAGQPLGFISLFREKSAAFGSKEILLLRETARFITLHLRKISLFHNTRELAFVDSLTQIFNRRYFDQRYPKEIGRAQRYERTISLLMVDIDHFKKYNDILGHMAGDEALRQVATTLEKNLRRADVVCRFGGEEFVVILPEIGSKAASWVAEKLRDAVLAVHFPGEEKLPHKNLTISIGVASFPENGQSSEEVLLQADKALYRAKDLGRNRVIMAGT
jgi:diguanylate cyclase (GGDEF)-like protein